MLSMASSVRLSRSRRPNVLLRAVRAVADMLRTINATFNEAIRMRNEAARRYPHLNFDQ
jgi:hypothetical protein